MLISKSASVSGLFRAEQPRYENLANQRRPYNQEGEDHVHTDLRACYLGGRLNVQDDLALPESLNKF